MEKRLFLAFILSFFILFTWNKMYPQQKKTPEENAQSIEKKQVIIDVDEAVEDMPPKERVTEQKLITLSNNTIFVQISNIGATIESAIIQEYNEEIPLTNYNSDSKYSKKEFDLSYQSNSKCAYLYQDEQNSIIKSYELDGNIIKAKVKISRKTNNSNDIGFIQAFKLDVNKLDKNKLNSRDKMLQEYSVSKGETIYRKKDALKISSKNYIEEASNVDWVGYRNRYFCVLFKPEYKIQKYEIQPQENSSVSIKVLPKIEGGEEGQLLLNSTIYIGPQDLEKLKQYNFGFEKIINYKIGGFFDLMAFGLTDFVAKIILKYLNFLSKIIHNLGVAIIILAVSISIVTYPFTKKSMLSMKKMQEIQPKLNKIREQYKNNPQKLNQEMMELYKENKVNPFGGCMPMLFQMPIFIGLYQVLWRSVSLKGAHFLWIKDLSEPDRLFTLSKSFPVIGNEINILPILMMIVMVFQQKISSKNMVAADPQQAQQQKMMMMFMPLLIGFIFYKFASGLALYFTTFYILSTLTHLRMSKIKKAV